MSIDPIKPGRITAGIYTLLALGTLALFWPATHFPFITLDDNLYVTANPQVQAGLSWAGLSWAATNTIASNWHPMTWLSHMVDVQFFGLKAGGHHLTNLLFHTANSLLLFTWLRTTTSSTWRSAFVAALFAWHPLHVESVAWIAERKDVLSGCFWLLALIAYTRYAKQPGIAAYLLVLALFFCGLMAKPMAVTLPCVLLLVDFWPLNRISFANFSRQSAMRLVLEKIPFFILAGTVSGMIYFAQKGGGATWSSDLLPFSTRLANAVISYVRYVSKTFLPVDLAVIYPYQEHWPVWLVITATALLLIGSAMAVLRMRQNPYVFFGWFYFIGTLVPVIGLVQVGPQAMADRYMYLPSIGLFILIAWGAKSLLISRPHGKTIAASSGAVALSACVVITSDQLHYWQNSVKLFQHTVQVTPDNYTATAYLGGALEEAGFHDEAIPFYYESVRITPHFPIAQWKLGMAFLRKGRPAEAAEHLEAAARLTPSDPVIQCYAGLAFSDAGQPEKAETLFDKALRLKPDYAEAWYFSAINRARQDQNLTAIPQFETAVKLAPDNSKIRYFFGRALNAEKMAPAAAAQFREAIRLQPDFPEAKTELDALLAEHPELK